MIGQSVCLFPLPNSVTLNKVSIPYHIFEPRYIKMVQDCFLNDYLIAVLTPQWNGEYEGRICVAGRPTIIQSYDNGELDIVITGVMKCRLEEKIQTHPYL